MKVASVTVNYKTADLTLRALGAVLEDLEPLGGRAIVVDNDSQDGSLERIRDGVGERGWSDRVDVLASPGNIGFGAGNNLAFRFARQWPERPEFFYLLNPDARPDPGGLVELVRFMDAHPRVGLAGSRVRHEDGRLRLSAFRFPGVLSDVEQGLRLGVASKLLEPWRVWGPAPEHTGPVDWVSGASVLIRSAVFDDVGMFDETFFLYYEETDLCLRAKRAGWPTYYVVESGAEHIGQVSTGFTDRNKRRPKYWFESRRHYLRKNHGAMRLWLANLGFASAYSTYRLRRRLQHKPDEDPPHFLWDFLRHNFLA